MWDFEHPPLDAQLALRYQIDRMLPSECATRLASGTATSASSPSPPWPPPRSAHPAWLHHRIEGKVRSLLLVRRASQRLHELRSVAADMASRTTLAHARILFRHWGNPDVPFLPAVADLDSMLERADAAILIGDPALMALEERANRFERTGEELIYHDLAEEWYTLTGLPFVSAVWAAAPGSLLDESVAEDFIQSRDHGLENIDALVAEWSHRMPLSSRPSAPT